MTETAKAVDDEVDSGTGRQRSRRRTYAIRVGVLVLGSLPAFAFPTPNLDFAAWFALVPGLLAMRASTGPREAAVRGWWFGAGYTTAVTYWLAPNIGPALVLCAALYGGAWLVVGWAVWVALAGRVTLPRFALAIVLVPSACLVTEFVRSWQFFGGPWALLGTSQWRHPAELGLAAIGGVWLVTAALVAANTGIVGMLVGGAPKVRIAGALVLVVAVGLGPAIFASRPRPHTVRRIPLSIVQPGVVPRPSARLRAEERITKGVAARRRRPDMILWGESSVGFDLTRRRDIVEKLEALSHRSGARLLVNEDAEHADGRISKTTIVVSPSAVSTRYVKSRLVPFGEYIPLRPLLGWIAKLSRAAGHDRMHGHGATVTTVATPHGPLRFGPLICFESAFPDMSRRETDMGARMIIYQSSTSTFQDSWAPSQHASLGALRAAETGRPVVQAALSGVSTGYDADGRRLMWYGTGRRGPASVRVPIPPASERTPYDRIGDVVPLIAVGIVALVFGLFVGRRLRGGSSTATNSLWRA